MSSHCCTGSLDHCHFSGANVLNTSARRSVTPANHKLTSVVVSLRMSSCASSQSTSRHSIYPRLRVWRTSCNIPWSTAPRDPASYRCRSRPLALEGPSVIQGQGCHVLEQGSRQLLYCSRNTRPPFDYPTISLDSTSYRLAQAPHGRVHGLACQLTLQASPWKPLIYGSGAEPTFHHLPLQACRRPGVRSSLSGHTVGGVPARHLQASHTSRRKT